MSFYNFERIKESYFNKRLQIIKVALCMKRQIEKIMLCTIYNAPVFICGLLQVFVFVDNYISYLTLQNYICTILQTMIYRNECSKDPRVIAFSLL